MVGDTSNGWYFTAQTSMQLCDTQWSDCHLARFIDNRINGMADFGK